MNSLWPYHWEVLGASLESDYWGSLCWLFHTMPYCKTIHVVITYGTQYFTAYARKTFQKYLTCVAESREALFCATVSR